MKTTTIVKDSRINRDNCMGGYMELCNELVKAQGYDKTFKGSCSMTWNEFKATAYRNGRNDYQLDIVLNFNTGEATITVDTPVKSKLDEEMELWEARSNDEFGTVLKELKQAVAEYFTQDNEFGFKSTPISWEVAGYSLEGNRKSSARVISRIIENYDLLDDEHIKVLVEKMNLLAA